MKKLLLFALSLLIGLTMPISASAAEITTPTGIPLSELESRIDELVATYMHEFTPGTAIAVVHNGEIVFSRGYGYADLERQISVDPTTTVFEYGSISKLFVYVSVMQLVERGLLDLDNDIHVYLPEDLAQKFNFQYSFTMRDLLNHSAGFGGFNFNIGQDAENVTITRTLREALIASQPPQIFKPGTATAYATFSSALAAYIVSYISGQYFSDVERSNIFNLLGMNNTRSQPDWFGDNVFMQFNARGHQPDGSGGFSVVPWTHISVYPGGGVRGTAEDLAKFAIALMPPEGNPGLLFNERSALDLMLSPSFSDPNTLRGTHHGFFRYDGIYPTIGHSGGTVGFGSQLVIVPSHQFGVIVLCNSRSAGGSTVFMDKVLDLLIGNTRELVPPSPSGLPNAESVTGTFVSLMRSEGNIFEPLNAIMGTHIVVEAIDENTITLTMNGATTTFRQIEPYIFRAVSADCVNGLAQLRIMHEIQFRMENGRPIGISSSYINDATLQTFGQSMLALIGAIGLLVIGTAFFLVMSIVAFVGFLRKKDKKSMPFYHVSNGLLACGLVLALNWIIVEVRFLSSIMFIQSTTIVPHIWINYLLMILSTVLLVTSLVFWKKGEIAVKRRVLYFLTITLLAAFILVLWQWNFFVMM